MSKFRVGDLVVGTQNSPYGIANKDSICEILSIRENFYVEGSDMEIYVIKGNYTGETVNASSRMFNLHKSNFRRMP